MYHPPMICLFFLGKISCTFSLPLLASGLDEISHTNPMKGSPDQTDSDNSDRNNSVANDNQSSNGEESYGKLYIINNHIKQMVLPPPPDEETLDGTASCFRTQVSVDTDDVRPSTSFTPTQRRFIEPDKGALIECYTTCRSDVYSDISSASEEKDRESIPKEVVETPSRTSSEKINPEGTPSGITEVNDPIKVESHKTSRSEGPMSVEAVGDIQDGRSNEDCGVFKPSDDSEKVEEPRKEDDDTKNKCPVNEMDEYPIPNRDGAQIADPIITRDSSDHQSYYSSKSHHTSPISTPIDRSRSISPSHYSDNPSKQQTSFHQSGTMQHENRTPPQPPYMLPDSENKSRVLDLLNKLSGEVHQMILDIGRRTDQHNLVDLGQMFALFIRNTMRDARATFDPCEHSLPDTLPTSNIKNNATPLHRDTNVHHGQNIDEHSENHKKKGVDKATDTRDLYVECIDLCIPTERTSPDHSRGNDIPSSSRMPEAMLYPDRKAVIFKNLYHKSQSQEESKHFLDCYGESDSNVGYGPNHHPHDHPQPPPLSGSQDPYKFNRLCSWLCHTNRNINNLEDNIGQRESYLKEHIEYGHPIEQSIIQHPTHPVSSPITRSIPFVNGRPPENFGNPQSHFLSRSQKYDFKSCNEGNFYAPSNINIQQNKQSWLNEHKNHEAPGPSNKNVSGLSSKQHGGNNFGFNAVPTRSMSEPIIVTEREQRGLDNQNYKPIVIDEENSDIDDDSQVRQPDKKGDKTHNHQSKSETPGSNSKNFYSADGARNIPTRIDKKGIAVTRILDGPQSCSTSRPIDAQHFISYRNDWPIRPQQRVPCEGVVKVMDSDDINIAPAPHSSRQTGRMVEANPHNNESSCIKKGSSSDEVKLGNDKLTAQNKPSYETPRMGGQNVYEFKTAAGKDYGQPAQQAIEYESEPPHYPDDAKKPRLQFDEQNSTGESRTESRFSCIQTSSYKPHHHPDLSAPNDTVKRDACSYLNDRSTQPSPLNRSYSTDAHGSIDKAPPSPNHIRCMQPSNLVPACREVVVRKNKGQSKKKSSARPSTRKTNDKFDCREPRLPYQL